MSERVNALRAQRAKILNDARVLIDVDGAPSAEVVARYDAMIAEADALKAQAGRLEHQRVIDAELAVMRAEQTEATGRSADEQISETDREKRLLKAWMGVRVGNLSDKDRADIAARCANVSGFENAAATTPNSAGGYTIAPEYQRELLIAQKAFGGMRAAARTIQTTTGANLPWPTLDDTGNEATIVGENTAGVPGPDMTFGSVSMQAFTWRSGYLPFSFELLQDSAFDLDALVRDRLTERFARGQNRSFTTGDGTNGPKGITTNPTVGKTGAAGQTTSVIYDDLVDLQHSIDPAYRTGAAWMMHDSSIKVLRKLKDSTGRPIWDDQDSSIAGMMSTGTLLGSPVFVNQHFPVMAAGATSIAYGQLNSYLIRDVMGLRLLRLNERFAENGQVAFLGFERGDGRQVTGAASASGPVKFYQNSAT